MKKISIAILIFLFGSAFDRTVYPKLNKYTWVMTGPGMRYGPTWEPPHVKDEYHHPSYLPMCDGCLGDPEWCADSKDRIYAPAEKCRPSRGHGKKN